MNELIKLDEFNSLLLYLFTFVIVSIFIALDKNKIDKKLPFLSIIGISIIIIISTFRYGVGTDYFNYKRAMESQSKTTISEYIQDKGLGEIGNFVTNKLGNIFESYNVVLAIRAIICIITSYIAIWQHRFKIPISIGMFLFMCIYFPSSLNLSTQFIAIGIVACSYKYIFEKNIIKFTSMLIIASLFHTTALFIFPIYFLWSRKKGTIVNKFIILISVIICIIIVKNINPILDSLSQIKGFESYLVYTNLNTQGNNRDIYIKLLLFILVFIFRKPLINYDKRNQLYILLILFNLILGTSGDISPWIKRMGLYFEITQLFVLPGFIKILNNKEKKIVGYTICLYGIVYFTLVYYILGQSNVIPYKMKF